MTTVVLLGPQRLKPTLPTAVASVGITGTIATVTAGWQEYEDDDRDLHEAFSNRTVNLRLHSRGEQVFRSDPEMAAGYRLRQERLRLAQEFYRIRLDHAMEAFHDVARLRSEPSAMADEKRSCLDTMRSLDAHHLSRCLEIHHEFDVRWMPSERESVAKHRGELRGVLDSVGAVAIAGGHVAVLLNRMELFGIVSLLKDQPVFAWSAGAMVLSDKVVLFHDHPPQGPGNAEVLDAGLGLAPGVVALPGPERRLDLDDRERVSVFARRFAPATALAMGAGAQIWYDGESWGKASDILKLGPDGTLKRLDQTFRPGEAGGTHGR